MKGKQLALAAAALLLLGGVMIFASPRDGAAPDKKMPYDLRQIAAQSECAEKGTLSDEVTYNANSQTWWMGLEMKQEFRMEGCSPACVVFAAEKRAEINWRCTGLVRGSTVDPMNLSFDIERNIIQLRNGEAIQEVQGTCKGGVCPTLRYETRVFGEPVRGDLNGDGAEDAAMILTQKLGGTGTFYYVVAGLADPDGGVSAGGEVFLGDRIAPQTMRIEDGIIEVNYADRRPQDSFATPPSVGKTIRIKVENGDLVRL